MPKTLITGINGFVGQHLAREMYQAGCEILGAGRGGTVDPGIAELTTHYYQCDLTNDADIAKLPLGDVDSVINLAGLANVGASFDNPELYRTVNVGTFTGLAKRLLEIGNLKVRLLAISTGAVYDNNQNPPFSENSLLVPKKSRNPYTDSKIQMEAAVKDYRTKGLDSLIVRPFNHLGPGQLPGFLVPDLAAQIKQAVDSGSATLAVGNLDNQRDFTDVRDVVRAYRLLALSDPGKLHHDIYNVSSGRALAGRILLNLLLAAMGAPKTLKVVTDKAKLRPHDPEVLYGDHTALTKDTGWQPTIPLEQTISDFVEWFKTS